MANDLVPVVLAWDLQKAEKKATSAETARKLLRGLVWQSLELLQQAAQLLPWLLCLLAVLGLGPGFQSLGAHVLFEQQALLGVGLGAALFVLATGIAFLCGHLGGDARPVLALLALLLWHLGFQVPGRSEEDRWRVAVLKAGAPGSDGRSSLDHHAAVGFVLLDDMIRALLRFLAREPSQAWPFALTNQKMYDLWMSDEAWWQACYRGANWQRLPANPHRANQPLPSPRRMLHEALLLASMMAETVGMMVLLQPRGASSTWAATPCIASTLLVVSCSPWLPRQSDIVLLEMSRLLSFVSKFSVYCQAVLLLLLGVFSQPRSPLLCSWPEEAVALRVVEGTALAVLYLILACRLLAVTARCRAASPLYAVPAEDVVPETLPRRSNRPLYCGSLGLVEGSYAPTQLCDWEDLCGPGSLIATRGSLSTRSRYILRRCGEHLVAREAHLLSHLDALNLRIEEAEKEAKSSSSHAMEAQLHRLPGLVATVLCLAAGATCTWGPGSRSVSSALGGGGCGGGLEAVLWAMLLTRLGHTWFRAFIRNLRAYHASGGPEVFEAFELRNQSCKLHRNLAETQRMIAQLEDRIESLGVPVRRKRCQRGWCSPAAALPGAPGAVGATYAIAAAWCGCMCALASFWPLRW